MKSSLSNREASNDPMGSETFASLWMALQNSYEGTNITRTVARLLHMYQPEDGLEAYERLLRTLYVLLGDFDSRGFKLLVSIIPPPRNISEDTIEDIFEKAVGFTRMTTLPDSHFLDFGTDDDSMNQISNLNNDFSTDDTILSSKSSLENNSESSNQVNESDQEPFFIGYPSQIDPVCNHCNTAEGKEEDQQILNPPGTSSDYRMKWIYTPYTLRKNAICQSTHSYNENTEIPVIQNNQESRKDDFCIIEDSSCVFKKPELTNVPRKRGFKKGNKISETKSRFLCSKRRNKKSWREKQKKIVAFDTMDEEEATMCRKSEKVLRKKLRRLQRAIQEDIYKMDVVQPDSKEIEIVPVRKKKQKFVEPSDFDINNNLCRSIQNFLHGVKDKEEAPKTIVKKVQIMTPSTSDPVSDETAAFIDCWKKIITKSVLGRDPEPEDLCSVDVRKEKITDSRKKGVKKNTEKKVNRKKSNISKRPKRETTSTRNRKRARTDEEENRPSASVISTKQINDFDNFAPDSSHMICESNSGNVIRPTDLVPEISSYKNFYDPLLAIQNSEDLSAANSKETDYNPYYFDYLQREYQLLEQRLSLGTHFSDDRVQSAMSDHQFGINSWIKSKSKSWSFPSFKQSQCPQHHLPVYPPAVNPSVFNFVPEENVSIEIIDCEEQEFNQLASDPNVIQKNLEDIFVVVKESENVSTNQS